MAKHTFHGVDNGKTRLWEYYFAERIRNEDNCNDIMRKWLLTQDSDELGCLEMIIAKTRQVYFEEIMKNIFTILKFWKLENEYKDKEN